MVFRKWKEVAHLQRGSQYYGMKDTKKRSYPKNNSPRSLLIKLIYFITYFYSSNKLILTVEWFQFLTFRQNKVTKSYIKLLETDKPSHIFFTHQRPPFLAPFLYAAQKMKIPVSSFIFSWDNLASKGRMIGKFDCFLVWSELMKTELLTFYPNVKEENIEIVGTPQFEPYVMDKYASNKENFLARFKLDPTKKIICFSCADASIGANDPQIITTIAKILREKKIATPCQLLVRTSPAEEPSRFEAVRSAFPEIIWNNPKWILTRKHVESWSQRVPSSEDITDLRAILEFSDMSINMCSTMSLDFMIFDKPVINTTFGNGENGLYDDQRFLKYVHYKKVIDGNSVIIAKNESELLSAINEALEHPEIRQKERKDMINLQISKPLLHTSKRIAKFLSRKTINNV